MVEEFLQHEWSISFPVNRKGQNILHVAAKNGRSNLVKYLLRHLKMDEFTLNQKDDNGNTPLHLASRNLFPKVLLFISEDNMVNVNLLNNNSLTVRDVILVSESQVTFRKAKVRYKRHLWPMQHIYYAHVIFNERIQHNYNTFSS
ncbi:hypothetical protein Fmac_021662 [Flemingia macrophylla]|uniref:Uncharacterized protein n=1 Tax=Flemingia macrophylla TaxID=520843 RepID=A0ABD1LZB2_9FABA